MIFDSIYELIDKHNPVSNNQSGLRSNGSCNVFSAFDANPSLEFFGVFFDLSKAFIELGMAVSFIHSNIRELMVISLNLLNCF